MASNALPHSHPAEFSLTPSPSGKNLILDEICSMFKELNSLDASLSQLFSEPPSSKVAPPSSPAKPSRPANRPPPPHPVPPQTRTVNRKPPQVQPPSVLPNPASSSHEALVVYRGRLARRVSRYSQVIKGVYSKLQSYLTQQDEQTRMAGEALLKWSRGAGRGGALSSGMGGGVASHVMEDGREEMMLGREEDRDLQEEVTAAYQQRLKNLQSHKSRLSCWWAQTERDFHTLRMASFVSEVELSRQSSLEDNSTTASSTPPSPRAPPPPPPNPPSLPAASNPPSFKSTRLATLPWKANPAERNTQVHPAIIAAAAAVNQSGGLNPLSYLSGQVGSVGGSGGVRTVVGSGAGVGYVRGARREQSMRGEQMVQRQATGSTHPSPPPYSKQHINTADSNVFRPSTCTTAPGSRASSADSMHNHQTERGGEAGRRGGKKGVSVGSWLARGEGSSGERRRCQRESQGCK